MQGEILPRRNKWEGDRGGHWIPSSGILVQVQDTPSHKHMLTHKPPPSLHTTWVKEGIEEEDAEKEEEEEEEASVEAASTMPLSLQDHSCLANG